MHRYLSDRMVKRLCGDGAYDGAFVCFFLREGGDTSSSWRKSRMNCWVLVEANVVTYDCLGLSAYVLPTLVLYI